MLDFWDWLTDIWHKNILDKDPLNLVIKDILHYKINLSVLCGEQNM